MAGKNGRADDYLINKLHKSPQKFDFFHAIWLLELLNPDKVPLGYSGPPSKEIAKCIPKLSFTFPPSSISDFIEGKKGSPPTIETTFLGYYGRHGVLPWHYTQRLLKERKDGAHAPKAFIDIFNHRVISLFFRAATKYRYPLRYRAQGDEMSQQFSALLGLSTEVAKKNTPIPFQGLLKYASYFIQPRSTKALTHIITDFLDVPVNISQFKKEWLKIDPDDRTKIGRRGQNQIFGQNFILGKRILSRQHRFRINIGPVSFWQYRILLPGTKRYRQLVDITRHFFGDCYTFDIRIKLKTSDVPGFQIGRRDVCLGQTAWLSLYYNAKKLQDPIFTPTPSREVNHG